MAGTSMSAWMAPSSASPALVNRHLPLSSSRNSASPSKTLSTPSAVCSFSNLLLTSFETTRNLKPSRAFAERGARHTATETYLWDRRRSEYRATKLYEGAVGLRIQYTESRNGYQCRN